MIGGNKECPLAGPVDSVIIGTSRKAKRSPGFGFHSVPQNWYSIATLSRQRGKKPREAHALEDEILVQDSQPIVQT